MAVVECGVQHEAASFTAAKMCERTIKLNRLQRTLGGAAHLATRYSCKAHKCEG
jgi:hypothetical protein